MPPEKEKPKPKPQETPGTSQSESDLAADLARLEAQGKGLHAAAQTRLEKLEPKKPPGFAKLPEKTQEARELKHLSAHEKLALLQKALKEKKLTPEQRFLFKKAALFKEFAEQLYQTLGSPEVIQSNFYTRKRMKEKFKDQLHTRNILLPSDIARLTPLIQREIALPQKWFQEHGAELFMKIISGQIQNIENVLPPAIRESLDFYTNTDEIKTEADFYAYEAKKIRLLRDRTEYQTAQDKMEELLAEEFREGRRFLGEKWIAQIKAEVAKGKIFRLYVDNQENWREAGMTEEQIQEYYNKLLKMEEEHEINKRIAEHILGKNVQIPQAKRIIHEQYVDMLGLGPWHNLKDETWDTITRELMINAPLIILSGGTAALGRAALSKVTTQWLEKQSAKWFGKKLLEETLLSKTIMLTARIGAGMLTEGTIFELTHSVLTGNLLRPLPDWGRSILWSSITLGAFHGSGRLSQRLFTKEIGGTLYAARLGKLSSKITNDGVRNVVETLLVKGHIEAATMLLIGALQYGAYSGSLEDFFQNIGDEILHAYITVGALKVAKPLGNILPNEMQSTQADKLKTKVPTIANEYNLSDVFKKAEPHIKAEIKRTTEHEALSQEQESTLIQKKWEKFLSQVERLRKVLGKSASNPLLDFESRFSQEHGDDISTWEARMKYVERLFREIEEKMPAESMRFIREDYDTQIAELPKEQPGQNDKKQVLRKIRDSLTTEEQSLSESAKKALIRSRFYQEMGKLSKIAGEVMDAMESYVRKNPEATTEEILAEAKKHGFDELPAEARKKMRIAALKFSRNRELIALALRRFSPAVLFEKIFRIQPYETVKLDTTTPFAIRFVLDPVDYIRVMDNGIAHQPRAIVEETIKTTGIKSNGCKFSGAGDLPELAGLITAVRNDRPPPKIESTAMHEERHSMYDHFFASGERYGKIDGREAVAEQALNDLLKTDAGTQTDVGFREKITKELPSVLEKWKRVFLDYAKDEIMAFSKGGTETSDMRSSLLRHGEKASYDYPGNTKAKILSQLPAEFSEFGERLYRRMVNEYERDLNRSINIASRLLASAPTPEARNALLGELSSTPIETWSTLLKDRLGLIADQGEETKAITDSSMRMAEKWKGYALEPDFLRLKNFLDLITTLFERKIYVHDIFDIFQKNGIFETIQAIVKNNVDAINYKEGGYVYPQTQRNRENGLIEDIVDLLDSFPKEVAERIEVMVTPEIERIADPEFRVRLQRAAHIPETLPL